MKQNLAEIVRNAFADQERFSKDSLILLIVGTFPGLKPATHKWLLQDLRRRNVIVQLAKNEYSLMKKPFYQPEISQPMSILSEQIGVAFTDLRWCLWSTLWFNEFTIHQFGRELIIIETEKELTYTMFNFLKEKNYGNVFLKPSENFLDLYADSQAIIVKPLISRSPLVKASSGPNMFHRPKLEKLLVDLHCQEPFLMFIPGSEYENIFRNAFSKYSINLRLMMTYAHRRGQENKIRDYIQQIMPGMFKVQDYD